MRSLSALRSWPNKSPIACLAAAILARLKNGSPIGPACERRMAGQPPSLLGEQDKNGLRYFLCAVWIGKNAHGRAVDQPDVALHDLRKRSLIGRGDEPAKAFGIGG